MVRTILVTALLVYGSAAHAEGRRGHAEPETESDPIAYQAYAYPPEPVAQAATSSFADAYCGGGHLGVQTSGLGVALSGTRDRVCARFAVADKLTALGDALLQLEDQRAVDTGIEMYREAFNEIMAAQAEIALDDTVVRRAFVATFGSLPLLNHLAPR